MSRGVDRAAGERLSGPLLLSRRGARMDRHAATRRLRHLAAEAGIRLPRMHPHMLRHTFVTTMLDAGVVSQLIVFSESLGPSSTISLRVPGVVPPLPAVVGRMPLVQAGPGPTVTP